MSRKRIFATFALILMLTTISTIFVLPNTNAQTSGTKNTFPIIGVHPNPIGVGQEVLIVTGITHPTMEPQIGWTGLTVTITKPDNTTETLGPFHTDSVGTTGASYIPKMVGTYYFQTHFPEQKIEVTSAGTPAGTTMKASDSEKIPLTVQEEQRQYRPSEPLPTEYWSRPIDAQNREWYTIAGSWLADNPPLGFAPNNDDAPETAHVLWAKTYWPGGLAGGELGSLSYSTGKAYENFFEGSVIIGGNLYYNKFMLTDWNTSSVYESVVAVDLKTGKELWDKPLISPDGYNGRLMFGQLFHWQSFNWYGAYEYLWTVSGTTWNAFEAQSGRWIFSMKNVPASITNIYGPNGEIMRYTVDLKNGWMTSWNSTRAGNPGDGSMGSRAYRDTGSWSRFLYGTTVNATKGLEWNVTIPKGLPGTVKMILDDRIIGSNTEFVGGLAQPRPVFWGISIAEGREGTLLFNTTWDLPIVDLHVDIPGSGAQNTVGSLEDGVFIVAAKETRQYYGFNLDTGKQIWGPTDSQPYQAAWDIIYRPTLAARAVAYGKLFTAGYVGEVNAYDIKTGKHLWNYQVKDPYAGDTLWGDNWPVHISYVTDGKIYLHHEDHSPTDPLERGAPLLCLNATTGERIYESQFFAGRPPIIGDNIIVGINSYDNRIYAIGKGPSAITASIQDDVIPYGENVLIQGTVTDISPGTTDFKQTSRFPNGVPAVNDEAISEWMEYVYSQTTRPTNATGVKVTLSVEDANGNFREIGSTQSNSDGLYSFNWKPDIEGKYTVYASFDGSKAYWPSHAVTAFVAGSPTATSTPYPITVLPPTEMYILAGVAAIIIAIAIVGAVLALLVTKKRP